MKNLHSQVTAALFASVAALMGAPASSPAIDLAAFRYSADRGDAYAQNELGSYCLEHENFGEAVDWFRMSAAQGYAPAYNSLGYCHEHGYGVAKDLSKAAACYRRGAEAGNRFAQYHLAMMLLDGNGVPEDKAAGLALLRKSAEQGTHMALYNLGVLHEIGVSVFGVVTNATVLDGVDSDGVPFRTTVNELAMTEIVLLPPDERKALEFYRRAQRKCLRMAWWKVGVYAEYGRFCRPDPAYARYCYEKAGPNIPQAVQAIARMDAPEYSPPSIFSPDLVFEEFVRRISEDSASAPTATDPAETWPRNPVARPAPHEWPALPEDPPEPPAPELKYKSKTTFSSVPPIPARPLRTTAAPPPSNPSLKSGSTSTARNTTPKAESPQEAYRRGLRLEKSPATASAAAEAYRSAAERGLVAAATQLGSLYYRGMGVRQDYAEAVKWYRQAADAGEAGAQNNLAVCYLNGRGVKKDAREAVKWFRKSAEQGYALAQHSLGACLVNGDGVRKDRVEAVRWFRKAAAQGNAQAADALRQLGVSP